MQQQVWYDKVEPGNRSVNCDGCLQDSLYINCFFCLLFSLHNMFGQHQKCELIVWLLKLFSLLDLLYTNITTYQISVNLVSTMLLFGMKTIEISVWQYLVTISGFLKQDPVKIVSFSHAGQLTDECPRSCKPALYKSSPVSAGAPKRHLLNWQSPLVSIRYDGSKPRKSGDLILEQQNETLDFNTGSCCLFPFSGRLPIIFFNHDTLVDSVVAPVTALFPFL